MRVYLESLGCKLNQAEVEDWSRQFRARGWELASSREKGALYVLNTCAVTGAADAKSRHLLRLARRQNPGATIVAAGCYASRCRGRVAEADLVFDNQGKTELVATLVGESQSSALPSLGRLPRTRALVKIQEGCDEGCRYCLVPRLRGRSRSYPAADIVAQAKQRVAEGYGEVVLTGTQPGSYRDGCLDLGGLVGCLLSETRVERLRLPSLQPQDITPALLQLFADERLCRHLHLPLQSGSDDVLARMGRRYTRGDFEAAVGRLREVVAEIAITTDVMVGFPGETLAEFEDSHRFCQKMSFASIHVFPFSPRPGTAAARDSDPVGASTKKARAATMLALAQESAQAYGACFLGRTLPVLWEEEKDGRWSGLTDNYLRVHAIGLEDLQGQIRMTRLMALQSRGLWGEPA